MLPDTPNSVAGLYSAPRRFDLATIMVVTLAYALLFGGLRLLKLDPIAILITAGLFTSIGIGQALFFRGRKPRLSSVAIGIAYIAGNYFFHAVNREPALLRAEPFVVMVWMSIGIAGAISGYLAGVAVGAVFLLSDLTRKEIRRLRG